MLGCQPHPYSALQSASSIFSESSPQTYGLPDTDKSRWPVPQVSARSRQKSEHEFARSPFCLSALRNYEPSTDIDSPFLAVITSLDTPRPASKGQQPNNKTSIAHRAQLQTKILSFSKCSFSSSFVKLYLLTLQSLVRWSSLSTLYLKDGFHRDLFA